MRVSDPVKVSKEQTTSTDDLLDKLSYANNSNSDMVVKALRAITFQDNFKNSIKSQTIYNLESTTFKHNLKYKPSVVLVLEGRVDTLNQDTSNANTVTFAVALKSSNLSAAVTASTSLIVLNTNIFKVNDIILVGSSSDKYTIKSISSDTRTIVVDKNVTANQFDKVQLYSDTVVLLIN